MIISIVDAYICIIAKLLERIELRSASKFFDLENSVGNHKCKLETCLKWQTVLTSTVGYEKRDLQEICINQQESKEINNMKKKTMKT